MTARTHVRSSFAGSGGGLVAVGALFIVVKGVVRAATGADPSLVPFFGGASAAAGRRCGRAVVVGDTGTVADRRRGADVVGGAYTALSVGASGSLAALGVVAAVNRSLPG